MKPKRHLEEYGEQVQKVLLERPMVLWHWEHIPYRDKDIVLRRKANESSAEKKG